MKYTDEYLSQICDDKNLEFVNTEKKFLNGKNRRVCNFYCCSHKEYGLQTKAVEKMESTKQPCVYCNHSNLKVTLKNEIDQNIELLDIYSSWDTPLLCKCKIHNAFFKSLPSVLLVGGTGCQECIGIKRWNTRGRITTDDFKEEVERIYPTISVIGSYLGSHEYVECECNIHKVKWRSYACNIKNGTAGCPLCSKETMLNRMRLSDEEVQNRLDNTLPHIQLLGNYTTRENDTEFYCNIHNISFITKPKYLLYGHISGCPLCSSSLGEIKLLNILISQGKNVKTQYIFNNCKHVNPLRFDVYDLDNNVAYEYQGQQHYHPVNFGGMSNEDAQREFELNQIRDSIKAEYCSNNKIPLILIPYWEYDNMEKYVIEQQKRIA